MANWIAGAIKHPGAFSRKAKKAHKTTNQYAHSVLKKGSHSSDTTKRQARLALTLSKMHKRR